VEHKADPASLAAVAGVLAVIGRMMHSDFRQRPWAWDLYPLVHRLYYVPGAPGQCETCEKERQGAGDTLAKRSAILGDVGYDGEGIGTQGRICGRIDVSKRRDVTDLM